MVQESKLFLPFDLGISYPLEGYFKSYFFSFHFGFSCNVKVQFFDSIFVVSISKFTDFRLSIQQFWFFS